MCKLLIIESFFSMKIKIFYFPLGLVAKIWLIPPGGLLPVMPTIHTLKKNSKNTIMFCTLSLSLRGRAKKFFCLKWWREREREKLCKKMNHDVFDQTKAEKLKTQQSSKFTTFISISYTHSLGLYILQVFCVGSLFLLKEPPKLVPF